MDRAAFKASATEHWPAVQRFAQRLTRDPLAAEDLVQDVYTQALEPRRIAAFEPRGGGLRSWLLRITYHSFLRQANRAKRDAFLFEPLGETDPSGQEALSAQSAASFDWDGVDQQLKSAVAELDVGAREVLLLWAVDHLSYAEIADVLGTPIGTVMSRLHRARSHASQSLLANPRAVDNLGLRPVKARQPRGNPS